MSQPARTIRLVKDPSGASAVPLEVVRQAGHISLAKRGDKAGLALLKRGLAGLRGRVVVLLDHSGSMAGDYATGAVQQLVERALGFAFQVDAKGTITIIPFSNQVLQPVYANLTNYQGIVDREIPRPRGGTNMAGALRHVQDLAMFSDLPIILIIVSDGSPDDRAATINCVCELSHYAVFCKALMVRPVEFFQTLDDLEQTHPGARLLDNFDVKPGKDEQGRPTIDLLTCTDLQFADAIADELDTWVVAATAAGVLS